MIKRIKSIAAVLVCLAAGWALATAAEWPLPLPDDVGLYPDGGNAPSGDYLAQINAARAVLDGDSDIVILCLGMSNLTHTCDRWTQLAAANPAVNPAISIVNAGWPGAVQQRWDEQQPFDRANQILAQNGRTPAQVDAVVYFNACGWPDNNGCKKFPAGFEQYVINMRDSLTMTYDLIKSNYAGTQLVFVTSREFAGWATVDLNPEPYAHWEGHAYRALIESRVDGVIAGPPVLWHAYQWDPSWPQTYYQSDGTHLSSAGLDVAAGLWMDHFLSNEPWFTTAPVSTPTPTSTAVPTDTPTPGPTPTPTSTAVPTATPTPTATPDGSAPTATPTGCPPWNPTCWATNTPRPTQQSNW